MTAEILEPPPPSTWAASLELELRERDGATRLTRAAHDGPLYVQKTFHPEGPGQAHVYLLHPPGGIVSGDALDVRVSVGRDAKVLLTSPGAGRAYRARSGGDLQRLHQRFAVADGATLEHLPQELIVFPGAELRSETEVELEAGARFIGWEIACLGLPARGEAFDAGALRLGLNVRRGGRLISRERLDVSGADRPFREGALGLRAFSASGTLVAGPFVSSEPADACVDELRGAGDPTPVAGVTRIGELVVVRALAHRAEAVRRYFERAWRILRPALLGVPARAPRIWAT